MFKVKVFNEYGNEVGTYSFDKREDAWSHAEAMNIMHYSTTVVEEKENEDMTTENIINKIVEEVKNKGLDVELKNVTKNGVELKGLMLKFDDKIGCVTYVDEMVKQLQKHKITMEKAVTQIVEALTKGQEQKPSVEDFMDLRYVLDNLYIGLQRRTQEDIEKKIYSDFEDFEAYLYIRKVTEDGVMSSKVHPTLLNCLGLIQRKAWEIAEQNTFAETKIKSMMEMMSELMGMPYDESIDDRKMYVLTNKSNHRGAAGVLDKEKLKGFAKKLGTKELIIIPSSIHEVLIVVPENWASTKDLEGIIQSVNNEQVDPVEQLGDKPVILKF